MVGEVITSIGNSLSSAYSSMVGQLPPYFQGFLSLILLVFVVVIYAIFIWKFYRFIATKNIIELNLNKYNSSENPTLTKLAAGFFYLVEYIIILPFLIFFWFVVFTLFLIVLTENQPVANLLLISTIVIAAIRMTSYYNEDLSKDIAKLLPFTLLAISILSPDFFSVTRIFDQFGQIPQFLNLIIGYLGFIIGLEIILRFFDFIFSLFGVGDDEGAERGE